MTARQREAGSARFDPGLFANFFDNSRKFFVLSVLDGRKIGLRWLEFSRSLPSKISISISVRAVRLVFAFVFIR